MSAKEPGFYWLQCTPFVGGTRGWSKPIVAEFDGVEWWLPGSRESVSDGAPVEVLSEKLPPPDRKR